MGKATEKMRNWLAYNKALVQRGALNIWIEKETVAGLVCQTRLREKWAPLSLCGCRHRVRSRNQNVL